jgi:hypothetical protein
MTKAANTNTAALGADLLWGVDAIGQEIGRDSRQAFHLLSEGHLPGKKIGGRWVASRSKLRTFLTELLDTAAA